jgi:hypothetical protein
MEMAARARLGLRSGQVSTIPEGAIFESPAEPPLSLEQRQMSARLSHGQNLIETVELLEAPRGYGLETDGWRDRRQHMVSGVQEARLTVVEDDVTLSMTGGLDDVEGATADANDFSVREPAVGQPSRREPQAVLRASRRSRPRAGTELDPCSRVRLSMSRAQGDCKGTTVPQHH